MRSPKGAIAVAILLAVPLTAGIVQAAIPDAGTGEITVCYKPYTGLMRLVDTESVHDCASDEEPLSWNQQGAPGLSGLAVKTGTTPTSGTNSNSPKTATATCDPGSVVIGTAVDITGVGGSVGGLVTVDGVIPSSDHTVQARAYEITPTNTDWLLTAYAFCAHVP